MSTMLERSRALVWAGGFLIEIARDRRLPLEVRQRAVSIARHFPTIERMVGSSCLASSTQQTDSTVNARFDPAWLEDLEHGPLTEATRLAWPTELESEPPVLGGPG